MKVRVGVADGVTEEVTELQMDVVKGNGRNLASTYVLRPRLSELVVP